MSARPSQAKAVLLVFFLSLLYLGLDQSFHLFEIPQLKTQDLVFRWRTHFVEPQPSLGDITIISVDDETMNAMNRQWPYRRSTYGYLIKELIPLKPKVIAFDFVFAGEGILPEDDVFLASSIQEAGNVIIASMLGPGGQLIKSEKTFDREASGAGVLNKAEDRDRGVRRGRSFYWTDKNPFAEWAWEFKILMFVKGLDSQTAKIEQKKLSLKSKQGDNYVIPLLSDKTFDINYKAKANQFRVIPFWKIFTKDFSRDAITNKIVLVGQTSRAFHDEHPTPLEVSPGVVMNANALLTLMDRDFIKRIPDISIKIAAMILALLVAWFTWNLPLAQALLLTIGLVLLLGASSLYVLIHNWAGDFFTIPFLVVISFLATSFYRQIAGIIENMRLRKEAITDPLTGLYTRRYLEVILTRELADLKHRLEKYHGHQAHDLCVLMTDVDHFKSVNDTYGHDAGDKVLREVASVLREIARRTDIVARFGGEEFTVVLLGTTKEEARKIAEKIRMAVEQKINIGESSNPRVITISLGLASALEDGILGYEKILKAADIALYHSKESGRNRVTEYSPDLSSPKK